MQQHSSTVLTFQIRFDGGVDITGSVPDLADQIGWLAVAIKHGEATAAYVPDRGLASIHIVRDD
jgi:hypothetical protein